MLEHYFLKDMLEVGIDEAGRGPLFGRVYVGAVILPQKDFNFALIKDSKKLSERKRMIAYDYIKENAIDTNTYYFDEKYIDEHNIFKATHDAMHKVLDGLNVIPDHILVDGKYFYSYRNNDMVIPHTCIEKGDNTYCSIAAASILAKVERDKYIYDMCDRYPDLDTYFDLRSNKGYGTKKHMEGLNNHGVSCWHRLSFEPCSNKDIITMDN